VVAGIESSRIGRCTVCKMLEIKPWIPKVFTTQQFLGTSFAWTTPDFVLLSEGPEY